MDCRLHGNDMLVYSELKRSSCSAFGRMPNPRIFQIQLPLDAPAGFVADLAPVIQIRDAAAFSTDELQLQRRIGV